MNFYDLNVKYVKPKTRYKSTALRQTENTPDCKLEVLICLCKSVFRNLIKIVCYGRNSTNGNEQSCVTSLCMDQRWLSFVLLSQLPCSCLCSLPLLDRPVKGVWRVGWDHVQVGGKCRSSCLRGFVIESQRCQKGVSRLWRVRGGSTVKQRFISTPWTLFPR